MFERGVIGLEGDHGDVEERGGKKFAAKNAGLMEMQAARAGENYRSCWD